MPGTVALAPRPVSRPTTTRARETSARARSAPTRLRMWSAGLIAGAMVLLATSTATLSRLSDQIGAIGGHDAPQVATASDVYFELSDLDAHAATLIMLGEGGDMSVNRLSALRTFRERDAQLDSDLRQAGRTATTGAERDRVRYLVASLTLYRQWVWQALTVEDRLPPQAPGRAPAASLGYYAEATTVLRADLLPTAAALRSANADDLDRSYGVQHRTAAWAIGLTLVLGAALLIGLIVFQRDLARRFRRLMNLPMLVASLCVLTTMVAVCVLFASETTTLNDARNRDLGPYVTLTQAQAVGYDAAGDASRYLIASDPRLLRSDMIAKSDCLTKGGRCVSGATLPAGGLTTLAAGDPELLRRWNAFQADDERVISLAGAGQLDAAVGVLTGISRGDAAIDLFTYNKALDRITAGHRGGYTRSFDHARKLLTWWPAVPAVPLGAAIILIMIGVRPRLAEYR